MSENNNVITLYPSNWLYNAGVLGIIRIFEKMGYDIDKYLLKDGSLLLDLKLISESENYHVNGFDIPTFGSRWLLESLNEITSKSEIEDSAEKFKKAWGILFNVFYRGFFNANTQLFYKSSKTSEALITQFSNYIKSFTNDAPNKINCTFCLREANATYKNDYTSEHSSLLGTSSGEKGVPNSFWNLNKENSSAICDYCSMIMISSHLSRIRMPNNSEIFINAPSFKVMYELNKMAKEAYGNIDISEIRTKREILATTAIEYTNKINATLGSWTGMNLEIVTKKNDQIDFFSLPYNVIKIITDRNIAAILSDLGEYRLYNIVIDEKYNSLINFAQKLLKLSTKDQISQNDLNLLSDLLHQGKNKRNLTQTTNKILKLYSLIEDKLKRNK